MTNEQDTRIGIINTLLTTPHRELGKINGVHQGFIKQDPLFYRQLAAWYSDKGEIRDTKEVFIINLCLSEFEGHREVGLALLRKLPPFQVARVVTFIHKDLRRNIPRSMRTEIERYLREREADDNWFDQSVLAAKKYLKMLYALLHIQPSERAQKILFEDNPPEDSVLGVLRKVAKEENPTEQAKLLMDNKIPFRVASSVVKNMTPAVIFALIKSMSDQELMNNLGSLKKRGVMDNPDLSDLINTRIKAMKNSKKVAALKGLEAVKHAGLDEEMAQNLVDVVDKQVKSKGEIKRPTALFIDKSSSMNESIEIGKQMAAMISAICTDDFHCYVFDDMSMEIKSEGTDINSWTKAFSGVSAGGCTCCGAPLVQMKTQKTKVEQIVFITDEGENRPPAFLKALQDYAAHLGIETPSVIILRCGNRHSWGHISEKLARNGVEVDVYEFNGDYYSLPNLIPFLTKPSKLELLIEIMNYELPKRQQPVRAASVGGN